MRPLLLVVGLVAAAVAAPLPSYIKVCKRNDPKIEDCIINSIEQLRPAFSKGIPELDVPAAEPLIIPEIVVSRPGEQFRAVGKNVKLYGIGNFQITSLKADIENLVFRISILIPKISAEADYEVDTRILVPIRGKGPLYFNATDVTADLLLRGKRMKKGGEEHVMFNNIEVGMKIVGEGNVKLEGLFNGDKLLGEATNIALNQNSRELLESIRPFAERTIGQQVLDIGNKIARHFSYDDLFPQK